MPIRLPKGNPIFLPMIRNAGYPINPSDFLRFETGFPPPSETLHSISQQGRNYAFFFVRQTGIRLSNSNTTWIE